jgi:hypothetical protein
MPEQFFRFYRLGLRCNPFRALTREEWAAVAVLPEALADALEVGFDHLQVLGEKGRGKTTALLALAEHYADAGDRVAYERIPEGKRRFQTSLRDLDRFLLDEAQRLAPRQRERLLRAASGGLRVVIASHDDLSAHFARRGLPLFSVRLEEGSTRGHLERVLARRVVYFALDEGAAQTYLTPDAIAALWETFGDDLRGVESLLYEVFQRLEAPGPVTTSVLWQFAPRRASE